VVLTIVGSAVFLVIGFVAQKKFIDGSAYLRYQERNPLRTAVWVRAGFATLPLLFMFGAAMCVGIFALLYHATQINFFGVLAALSGVFIAVTALWAAKEYWQPTARRRPAWWDQYERRGGA